MRRFLELSFLCSGLQKRFCFQYKEHKVCLTKIPTYGIFQLMTVIYFQKMCIVTCDFLDVKMGALLCDLNGFGIAVLVFIRNIQLDYQLYNHCTRLWLTKWYKISLFHELFLILYTLFQRQ